MVEYILPISYKLIIKGTSVEIVQNQTGSNTNTNYIIDLTHLDKITTVDIYNISIYTVLLPDNIQHLSVYNSKIQTLSITSSVITTITLHDSPGVYVNIKDIPSSVVSLCISGDYIPNFRIPDGLILLRLYKCKIDKITNVVHHIQKETNRININESSMIIVFEDIESPYILAHIQTFTEWNFTFVQNIYTTLKKLYIIEKTNQDIETQELVNISVRLRLNVFRQYTHTTNTIDTESNISSIYQVMRLSSNYPRRWIEFVSHR